MISTSSTAISSLPANSFFSLFSRDNITLAIALIGAFGTIWGFYQNRFKIKCSYISQLVLPPPTKVTIMYFNFLIENQSRLPVSISRIYLSIDGLQSESLRESYPVHAYIEQSGRSSQKYPAFTLPLPVKIEGLGAVGGYFRFHFSEPISESKLLQSKVTVTIATNRGKRDFTIVPQPSTLDALSGTGLHPYHN